MRYGTFLRPPLRFIFVTVEIGGKVLNTVLLCILVKRSHISSYDYEMILVQQTLSEFAYPEVACVQLYHLFPIA